MKQLFLSFSLSLFLIVQAGAQEPSEEVKKEEGLDGVALAFLALNSDKLPKKEAFVKALAEQFGKDVKLEKIEIDQEERSVSLTINGHVCVMMQLGRPIPWGDLEGPCATTYFWKDATKMMKAHKDHYICTMLGGKTKYQQTLYLTKAMAALAATSDTAGIYWGNATLVTEPSDFIELAKEATAKKPPITLWVDYRMWHGENKKFNVVTTGLDAFGKMDVEIIDSERKRSEVMNIVMAAVYVQLMGDVFKDGDTIGHDNKMKIPTKHAKSLWEREGKVLRIDF